MPPAPLKKENNRCSNKVQTFSVPLPGVPCFSNAEVPWVELVGYFSWEMPS